MKVIGKSVLAGVLALCTGLVLGKLKGKDE